MPPTRTQPLPESLPYVFVEPHEMWSRLDRADKRRLWRQGYTFGPGRQGWGIGQITMFAVLVGDGEYDEIWVTDDHKWYMTWVQWFRV